jgi:ABC-2 type transport system ATP-binding protein
MKIKSMLALVLILSFTLASCAGISGSSNTGENPIGAGSEVIKVSKVQDLMIEAQQENIVEFGIDSNGLNVEKLLTGNFPDITIKSSTDHSIRISSKNQIEIMPFMKLFDNNGIKINEAKVIRPSLEEIFVKITGIEIDKLQKEKEGKQK